MAWLLRRINPQSTILNLSGSALSDINLLGPFQDLEVLILNRCDRLSHLNNLLDMFPRLRVIDLSDSRSVSWNCWEVGISKHLTHLNLKNTAWQSQMNLLQQFTRLVWLNVEGCPLCQTLKLEGVTIVK